MIGLSTVRRPLQRRCNPAAEACPAASMRSVSSGMRMVIGFILVPVSDELPGIRRP